MKIRYQVLAILTFALSTQSCTQQTPDVQISVEIKGADGFWLKIKETGTPSAIDSVQISGDKFEFNAQIPETDFYQLSLEGMIRVEPTNTDKKFFTSIPVYLETGKNYKLEAADPLSINGGQYTLQSDSKTNTQYQAYQKIERDIQRAHRLRKNTLLRIADSLVEARNNDRYKLYIDSLNVLDSSEKLQSSALLSFIASSGSSLVIPYLINKDGNTFENYLAYKKALNSLSPEHRDHDYAKKAEKHLANAEILHTGATVPPIKGADVNDKAFEYDFSKNRYTLVNIWAAWSPASRYDMIDLKPVYQKYSSKGFDIVSISVDTDKAWWKRISKYDQIPWYNVSEAVAIRDSENVKNFNAKTFPLNYLLGSDGRVLRKDIEVSELDELLAANL